MLTWRKAAVIGGMFVVCTSVASTQTQTGPKLAWDAQSPPAVTGYAVTIDGVRTNYGVTPLGTNGTCGCSILIPFSGGRHTIIVTAINSFGETPSAPFTVAPVANAGGPYSGLAGSAIAVSAASSVAPTGSLTTYAWRWGDGTADTSSSTPAASHVYAAAGAFTVTLTVTDNAGATATATTTATISAVQVALPAPWLTQDVGSVGLAGTATYSSGRFTVAGAGADIWNNADAFRFAYQPLNGDGQIVARVTSVVNTNAYAKAGVMIRESLNANSAHALVSLRPSGVIDLVTRATAGATTINAGSTTQPAPAWLKLARTGSTIVASVSADGSSWSVVATTNVTMASSALVGLVVMSHDITLMNTGVFDNVTVTTGGSTQPPAVPGSPTPANGATGVAMLANLTWSAVGATSYDVSFGTANPPPQVASGLTAASYAPSSMIGGTVYYWRVVARNAGGTSTGPVWSFTTAPAPGGGVPAPWISQDIGSVGVAGNASFSSGTFTIAGGGVGFWDTSDAFQFVNKPMTADSQIVGRVTGLQNTQQYAKAGLMMRQSLAANAPQVTINAIPGGGIQFLSRATAGASVSVVATASQSTPAWLKLVQSGSTITGYVSANGSTWTQVGSANVGLGSAPYIGLAVTSYTNNTVNTATFDSVTVTDGVAPLPPPTSNGDVVIYASAIPTAALHGSWQVASDPLSPNQTKLTTTNTGVANTSAPLAAPRDYVDVTFNADANKPYRLWLRLRATGNSKSNDSLWVQFSDALASGNAVFRMNTTSGLLVNLATTAAATSLVDWGWQNTAYWLSQPTTYTFPTSGMHTLRIQVREDGVQFDQIVLSPSRYLNTAPGPVSGDSTIVPIQ